MARFLVDQTLKDVPVEKWNQLKVGDLACGSGVFLRNYLKELHNNKDKTKGITAGTLSNLCAIDKNSSAVAAAKLSIAMTTYRYTGKLFSSFKPIAEDAIENYLGKNDSCPNLDIILMNPPFKGYESMNEKEREQVKQILGELATGRTDYSHAFIEMALQKLNENGRLGIVLPYSFANNKNASLLREKLANNGNIQLLAKLEDYTLFDRGETQIVILVYKKRTGEHSSGPTRALICRSSPDLAINAVEMDTKDSKFEWEYFIADSSDWNKEWRLMPVEVKNIIDNLSRIHFKLSDIFEMRQGIRIGLKKAFIIEDYKKLPKDEYKILKPIADDENVFDWNINDDERRLIYAYENGKPIPLEKFKNKFPTLFKRLFKFKNQLQNRSGFHRKSFWELSAPRDSNLMFKPKIVSTNFGLQGNYALDLKGKYALTNGSILVPKKLFINEDMWRYYLGILNSELFQRILSRKSRRLKGGHLDLDQRFTGSTPVPLFEETDPNAKKTIIEYSKKMVEKKFGKVDHNEYNKAIYAAFRLDPVKANII